MCGKAVIVKVLERFYWQLSEGTMMSTKGERKKENIKEQVGVMCKGGKSKRERIREVSFPSSSADGESKRR